MPSGVTDLGCEVYEDMRAGLKDADVVMMLRLQKERMDGGFIPSEREYYHRYGLDAEKLAHAKEDAIVMHPGPMNRGVEIDGELADDINRSVIQDQVEMGVAVRMACMTSWPESPRRTRTAGGGGDGVSYRSLVAGVLLPGETLFGHRRLREVLFVGMAPYLFVVIACVFLGSAIWSILETFFFDAVAVREVPYVQIISGLAVAFFCFWVGVSGKAFVPQPWYGLTQRRMLIVREDRYTPPTMLARFIEPNRAVQVAERGAFFDLTVPVVPEATADPGFETLNGLSRMEMEQALTVINKTLGMNAQ